MPTVTPPDHAAPFDPRSGSWIERLLFNHRRAVLLACAVVTLLLGWQTTRLSLNASFEKTIPQHHAYIQQYQAHKADLVGLGNAVRIAVANPDGTVYDAAYLDALRRLSDEVFLIPGVNRVQMKSLWTPSTRWVGVTEDGLEGGPVIPDGYDGSPTALSQLQANIARSGEIGQLVALDARSSVVFVPLLERDGDGHPLDYARFATRLEELRAKYEQQGVRVHITGFAKLVGDLIDGVRAVLLFFAIAVLIATGFVFWFTRCARSTALVVVASLTAVVWQLGLLPLMGYQLDPYSILVPFLVFAIGMSHGAQKMNGIMQDVGRGMHRLVAARFTFRRLFLAGLTALLADAVGFAVLLVIDIQVIRELAVAASIGVAMLVFTNLILLPVLLSYTGVSAKAAARSLRADAPHRLWAVLDLFTQRRWATVAVTTATLLGIAGFVVSTHLKTGDLDPGAPELRADSRYNRDVAFVNQAYGASSDVLAVMVTTPDGRCAAYDTLNKVDALEWELRQLDGVESTNTLALLNRRVLSGLNEGNPKWYGLVPNQDMLNTVTAGAPRGLYNDDCSLLTLYAFLRDHKADTLSRVVGHVEAFAARNDTGDVKFRLAAGSAGIEAATNIVVREAWRQMLLLVYGAVVALCFIAFRSWRAVVVAIVPLVLTSILAEALMVGLGMGVKVATLPVIALGVGIGVDYALYILSVTLAQLREGRSLSDAYRQALLFTGRVVMLTGVTLAIGVVTWVASPIKFQTDMGLLLAFMFLWNMLGALVLVPALAHFLLKPARPVAAAPARPRADGFRPRHIGMLLLGHCAGMLDLVGLPVWVGANLIGFYRFDPQQAGLLATVFLLGAVVASLLLAPRYGRLPARQVTVAGYAVAALGFVAMATLAGHHYPTMLVLHAVSGLGAGSALTMVDGTLGRSDRPHRLFACAGVAVAVFGIVVLGGGPALIGALGGAALWWVFAGVMGLAALAALLAFPPVPAARPQPAGGTGRLSRPVWFGIVGMGLLCMAHSTIFPFVERMGIERGYAAGLVAAVLASIGFANLVPSPLAAVLERRLRPARAIVGGTLLHAALVLLVTQVPRLEVYVPVVALLTTPLLFVHTFLFGLIARLDPSGRAVAATPAMLMIGSAIGPALGGTLLVAAGDAGLGLGVAGLGLLAAACFFLMRGPAAVPRPRAAELTSTVH